jgi:hypothetical protein
MKLLRRFSLLGVLIVALAGLLTTDRASAVADPCGRPNQVQCIEYGLEQLQNCVGSPGYCANQFDNDYTGCMVLKGCASPPPPVM